MYSVVRPWKAFVRHFAWVAVVAAPDVQVSVQMARLMEEYKKCAVLFAAGRLHYTGDWVPTHPTQLSTLSPEEAVGLFLQSTAQAGSSTTESALYHKVKLDVKLMQQFMVDWCSVCPCETRQPGCFFPATIPDGSCRDRVFAQILLSRIAYRNNELNWCFKYAIYYALDAQLGLMLFCTGTSLSTLLTGTSPVHVLHTPVWCLPLGMPTSVYAEWWKLICLIFSVLWMFFAPIVQHGFLRMSCSAAVLKGQLNCHYGGSHPPSC